MPPTLLLCHGPRAAEEALFQQLAPHLAAPRRDPGLLAVPVRVVVPSVSLRNHLAAAALRRAGGSLAGLEVQTLFAAAREILARSHLPAPRGMPLFDLLVRRLARREPPLRERLEGLADGYGMVAATVRDLRDAGFEAAHGAALEELLDELQRAPVPGVTRQEVARCRALLRLTSAVADGLAELGAYDRARLLAAAREAVERRPQEVLPTRWLAVCGFADATGVVTDLLEALLRAFAGTLLLDHPGDPTGRQEDGEVRRETAFPARFLARLSQLAAPRPAAVEGPAAEPPELLVAPDPEAEARAVARRIRGLLARGENAEEIAVVARDLAPYALPLRRQLRALGVPFSGVGAAGPLTPEGRDLAALLELLGRGPAVPVERWLDLLRRGPRPRRPLASAARTDLRLALFGLGASRLADVPRLEVEPRLDDGGQYRLPLRQGLATRPDDDGEEGAASGYAAFRKLQREVLSWAVAAARHLCDELDGWRQRRLPYPAHREALRRLIDEHLGWGVEAAARHTVEETAAALADEVPAGLRLTHEELVLLLTAALEGRMATPLGGAGGGVQLLDALEARGRTFSHIFVVGLHRDLFPRPVRDDPLLPDRLRAPLSHLLPDLPIKAQGFDEERHLFAALLAAAPRVTLSRPEQDAAGRPLGPSPLVERLAAGPAAREPALLTSAHGAAVERPVEEALVVAALRGGREELGALLPGAFAEVRAELAASLGLEPEALAAARRAVLDELDPDRRTPEGAARARLLGPFFGFVGPPLEAADPRRRELYVTTLERLAACPWQTFLRRLLHLEEIPDPLASLPTLRGLLVGMLVHRTLERLVRDARGERQGPVAVPWPDPERLDALLAEVAAGLLRDEGLGLRGLARAAVEQTRPYLEAARDADWEGGEGPLTLGVEEPGGCTVEDHDGRRRTLRFRADRVDQRSAGGRRFTDYKSGAPPTIGRDPAALLRAKAAAGEWLQVPAYVASAGGPAGGRYLFLAPDLEADKRVVSASAEDEELRRSFTEAVCTLLAAWDAGAFFPRLVEPDDDREPPLCRRCEVAEACLRGDSGARGRLRRWAEGERDAEAGAAAALLGVWRLRGRPATEGQRRRRRR